MTTVEMCKKKTMWRKSLKLILSTYSFSIRRDFLSTSSSLHQEKLRYQKYFHPLFPKIQDIHNEIKDEYSRTCESDRHDLHDIFGDYEYFYKRKDQQNYSNFYRKPIAQHGGVAKKATKESGKSSACRRTDENEELLVDINKLGEVYNELMKIQRLKISSDHQYIAMLVSLEETQRQKLLLKSLKDNVICEISLPKGIPPEICDLELDIASFTHNETPSISLYLTCTEDGIRPSSLRYLQVSHRKLVGSLPRVKSSNQRMRVIFIPSTKVLITESDPTYFLMISRSRDHRYLLIHHLSKTTSEVSLIDSFQYRPTPQTRLLVSRSWGKQCFVNHVPGYFLLASRDLSCAPSASPSVLDSCDLRIFRYLDDQILQREGIGSFPSVSTNEIGKSNSLWPPIGDSSSLYSDSIGWIDDYDIYPNRIVAYGKRGAGLVFIQLINTATGEIVREFNSANLADLVGNPSVSHVIPGANSNYLSKTFRFSVSSPVLPEASFEIDLESGEIIQTLINSSTLLQPLKIQSKRLEIQSHDGYAVPLTVFSSHASPQQCQPTLLLGYGSYGVPLSLDYSPEIAVMLSRGWQVAYAHTRGGGELGRFHHEQGRRLKKWNTFHDFRSCAEYLIQNQFTTPDLLCGSFGSAGGLIGGVLINQFPYLFRAIVMRNPFLDIYTTVQDPSSSALVVHEYDEWGHTDDNDSEINSSKGVLDYIRSYSPCENILKHSHSREGTIPAVLISVGLRDDKVSPEESFKWISLLRQHLSTLPMVTSRAPLLLHIQDQGGHDGSSSLTEQFHDQAVEIAFLESQTSTPFLPHPL